jgi:hypothetical protein
LLGGAKEMRSTRTWSPIRSVLTMDAEGISKFWKMKVMTKRPTARTEQMEASDSRGVSVSAFFPAGAAGEDGLTVSGSMVVI